MKIIIILLSTILPNFALSQESVKSSCDVSSYEGEWKKCAFWLYKTKDHVIIDSTNFNIKDGLDNFDSYFKNLCRVDKSASPYVKLDRAGKFYTSLKKNKKISYKLDREFDFDNNKCTFFVKDSTYKLVFMSINNDILVEFFDNKKECLVTMYCKKDSYSTMVDNFFVLQLINRCANKKF